MSPPSDPERGTTSRQTAPAATSSVPIPRIEVVVDRENGAAASRSVVLDGDLLRIGSHESNDLVLDDPLVSRFHCRLVRGPRAWQIVDTASLNGTRVSGVAVRDADLALPDCCVELGGSLLRVRELTSASSEEIAEKVSLGGLFGRSAPMRRLFHVMSRVARTDATVLIEGETGTGKEVVAQEIVQLSKRRDRPLIIVDCGAIPPNLIESELFGHAKGAFTGAHQARVGAFEAADGGTVFLDEIGELPLDMQPKLLRALAQREIRRMGENHARTVDVRVIAATNRQLEREVNAGRFREDLYFRLAVVTLRVPALRERPDDIPLLVDHFLATMNAGHLRDVFTKELLAEMGGHSWPGNVRELRNYVERRVYTDIADLISDEAVVRPAGERPAFDPEVPFKVAKDRIVTTFEREYLSGLLAWADGNVSRAARKAGLDRMYVHRLLQRHGIERPEPPRAEAGE